MNWFAAKRVTTIDRPTVVLTRAERESFHELVASFGRTRRLTQRVVRALTGWRLRWGLLTWGMGAVWIELWFTTSVPIGAFGAVPFMVGMRSVVCERASLVHVTRALRRLVDGPRSAR